MTVDISIWQEQEHRDTLEEWGDNERVFWNMMREKGWRCVSMSRLQDWGINHGCHKRSEFVVVKMTMREDPVKLKLITKLPGHMFKLEPSVQGNRHPPSYLTPFLPSPDSQRDHARVICGFYHMQHEEERFQLDVLGSPWNPEIIEHFQCRRELVRRVCTEQLQPSQIPLYSRSHGSRSTYPNPV